MTHEGRLRFRLWLEDRAPALGGLALVAIGSTGSPVALTLGWVALGIVVSAWVFHAERRTNLRSVAVARRRVRSLGKEQ